MSFAYSAGVITQTGTDTDLSGISGLTGISTQTSLVESADWGQVTYIMDGSTRLDVQGTLTISPENETLIVEGEAVNSTTLNPLIVSGTLNYGTAKTSGGRTIYSQGCGLMFTAKGANFFNRYGGYVSGTLIWNGGVIKTANTFRVDSGATLTVNKGVFNNTADDNFQLRLTPSSNTGGANLNIYDLTMTGRSVSSIFFTTWGFNTAVFSLEDGFAQQYNGNYPQQNYKNFQISNNISGSDFTFTNQNGGKGGNIIFTNISELIRFDLSSGRYGYVEMYRDISISPIDLDGNGITYSFHGVDINNGNRVIGSNDGGVDADGQPVDQDKTADIVYTGINQIGSYADTILIGTQSCTNSIGLYDDRTTSNTIPIKIVGYKESISVWTGNLIGLNTLAEDAIMTPDLSVTEAIKATVDAYTTIDIPEEFYDRAKSYLFDNFSTYQGFLVTRNGSTIDAGSYNIDIDATAVSAFDFDGSKITIKASTFTGSITTTGTITLLNGAVNIGSITDSGGTKTTLQYSITGLVNNSRVQLYNMTTMTEIYNEINGVTVNKTYTEGVEFTEGDTVRLRATNVVGLVGYKEYETTGVAGATGFSFLVTQELDSVYNSLGIDGSTITNFSADYVNDEIDIVVGSDFLLSELYAWWEYEEYSEEGIRSFFGGLTGVDEGNFNIHNAIVDIKLDNTTATNVAQLDNRRLYRDDLTRPVVNPTSGGGGIDVEWRSPVLLANSDQIEADLTSIESKIDIVDTNVDEILLDTDELQQNQGDWVTATGFSTFDPANDTVANVTLVDTTTTNTDMRGTDSVPTNPLLDNDARIDNLDATISSRSDFDNSVDEVITDTASRDASKANVSGLSTFDPSSDTVANVTTVQTTVSNTDMRGTDSVPTNPLLDNDARLNNLDTTISSRSNFDNSIDEVVTDSASRDASKANVSLLGTHADLVVINTGVKKASQLKPHTENLP